MKNSEDIKIIITIVQTILTIAGLTIAFFQLKKIINNSKDNFDWNRRAASLKALDLPIVEPYVTIRKYFLDIGVDIYNSNESYDDVINRNKSIENEFDGKVNQLFNLFEEVSLCIKHGIYDEDVLRDGLLIIFITYYNKFKSFLLKCNHDENRSGEFGEYLSIVKKWILLYETEKQSLESEKVVTSKTIPRVKL